MTTRLTASTYKRLGLVLASLILALLHFGPLEGTFAALLLTVVGQVALFGYLAARALGIFRESENVVIRLIWVVTCGLCINIVLGAAARLVLLPVSVYVVSLHALMALISLVPASVTPLPRIERKDVPLYMLLAVACLIFIFVGWQRNRLWIDGYEDPTLPASLAEWWADAAQPENLVTRQIAETNTISYWSSDGLTYALASWVWTGGFSAAQLIWYAITPLFAWLVPLAHYAVVFRLTKRADTATWAAGVVLILALTTINSAALFAGAWMFGQEAAFQLNTLRTFSTALLIPLVLFVFFTLLRSPHVRFYFLTCVAIFALALAHPRQFLALLTVLMAVLGLRWLLAPSRARLRQTVLIALILLPALVVPVLQYTGNLRGALRSTIVSELSSTVQSTQSILEPGELLFNPLVALAVALSFVAVVRLRQSLAAQFMFTASLVMFAVSYVPPIFNSLLRIFGSYFGLHYVLELFYIVPYGLVLGIAVSFLSDQLAGRVRLRPLVTQGVSAGCFALAALVLIAEPFPFAQSARDQINSKYVEEQYRDIHLFDQQLLNRLRALPVDREKMVYLTGNRVSSYVIESVPNAFVTGGRAETNPAFAGTVRFFESPEAPWLDAEDIAYLQTYPVDYLVIPADTTRLPQLMLQPDRFEWVDSVAGYLIFHGGDLGTVSEADSIFAQMNAVYAADPNPRWDADGFHLDRAPDADLWQPVIAAWQAQLTRDSANDVARYGFAYASLMAGSDATDLWRALSEARPDIFLLTDGYAQLLAQSGQMQAAANLLLGKLDSPQVDEQVLAARALLTDAFFPLLTPDQLDAILALEQSDPATWMQLMEWPNANPQRTSIDQLQANAAKVRARAALLMGAGRSDVAERWLDRLPLAVS